MVSAMFESPASGIGVKEIIDANHKVSELVQIMRRQDARLRQKDKDMDFLKWRLQTVEAHNLILQHAEHSWASLFETVTGLFRVRVVLGNHTIEDQSTSFAISMSAVREELRLQREKASTHASESAMWKEKSNELDTSCHQLANSVSTLKQAVQKLEREVGTKSLAQHFESELAMRDDVIHSLREHNQQLLNALKAESTVSYSSSAVRAGPNVAGPITSSPKRIPVNSIQSPDAIYSRVEAAPPSAVSTKQPLQPRNTRMVAKRSALGYEFPHSDDDDGSHEPHGVSAAPRADVRSIRSVTPSKKGTPPSHFSMLLQQGRVGSPISSHTPRRRL